MCVCVCVCVCVCIGVGAKCGPFGMPDEFFSVFAMLYVLV